MTGELFLVSTPIGNLGDITLRAVETLRRVDFIAAEDTRVTAGLLRHLDIAKPQVSYYEHNRRQRGEQIVARLLAGETCALVTDAGTPAISDPGEELVAQCAAAGVRVTPVPGACAAVAALSQSGLPTGRFCFEGFLSTNAKSRRAHLDAIRAEPRTLIFYEAPHKLLATLADLYQALGERRVAVCREITKLHEQCLRLTLSQALAHFEQTPPRGEFVLVVEGAAPQAEPEEEILARALGRVAALREQGCRLKEAVRQAAQETGAHKNALYQAALRQEEGE